MIIIIFCSHCRVLVMKLLLLGGCRDGLWSEMQGRAAAVIIIITTTLLSMLVRHDGHWQDVEP